MKVKLLKTVLISAVDNLTATARDSVVEVDDAEGKELVKSGLAEETTAKVTAEAKQAPLPENKMAPDADNKAAAATPAAPAVTRAVGTAKTTAGARRGGR